MVGGPFFGHPNRCRKGLQKLRRRRPRTSTEVPARRCLHGCVRTAMYAWIGRKEVSARRCLHGGACTEGLHGGPCTERPARKGLHGSSCTERAARRCLHGGHSPQNVEKQHHDHRRGTGEPCIFLRRRGVPQISLETLVKKGRTGNGEKIKNIKV